MYLSKLLMYLFQISLYLSQIPLYLHQIPRYCPKYHIDIDIDIDIDKYINICIDKYINICIDKYINICMDTNIDNFKTDASTVNSVYSLFCILNRVWMVPAPSKTFVVVLFSPLGPILTK